MGKKGIVIALFCIISFSPLSVMAGGSGTLIEKGSADATINAEAYVAEWESGKMVLKRTDSFDRFMSTPPYEASEEAYSIDRDSITMRPTLKSDNINRLMSMPPYEVSGDVTSYSHPHILSAGASQSSELSSNPEASSAPQQCDWCYEQTS